MSNKLFPHALDIVHVDPRQLRLLAKPICPQLQSRLKLRFLIRVRSFCCQCRLLLCVQKLVPASSLVSYTSQANRVTRRRRHLHACIVWRPYLVEDLQSLAERSLMCSTVLNGSSQDPAILQGKRCSGTKCAYGVRFIRVGSLDID